MADSHPIIEPAHTALVVMDYQPGVLQRLSDGDALVERAGRAIANARRLGMTVAYVHLALTDA